MDHEHLEESLSLYALGTLGPETAGEVHAHLATGCPRCRALLRQYQSTAAMLPYALAPHAPPAGLKSRVMAAISGQSAPAKVEKAAISRRPATAQARQTWWSSPALAAVLGGLLAGVGVYTYYLTHELNRAVKALGTTHELLAKHQEQLEVLQTARAGRVPKDRAKRDVLLAGGEDLLRILSSPTAKMADLHGTDMAKNAYALVFVEPETRRGFFYANNLPELPAGKTYQLWVITDKPVSVGVFSIDRGRKGRMVMRDIPALTSITQFAVSMEPAGGRPQPSGSIYLAGAM